ncbi:AEC family transporter [Palleronia sp. LCG004]|uniref:AEC family transporter n=1 Tax=Palleronia sp. LCG004 TaxID=3079304 RepID=UPI002943DC57|nr:AEC family transporter [Palleronia sp. LCG004]WOI57612.1 AEC family transporter [Palleronia sp. LCG004]
MDVLAQTLPFFALIGLGYGAGRVGMFGAAATAALTSFVFYFALSALLFRFTAGLDLSQVLSVRFLLAYFCGTLAVYLLATVVGVVRGRGMGETAVEAQCAVIGNIGFLGIPMLGTLMGEAAVGPILQMITVDLILFGSVIVVLITLDRGRGDVAELARGVGVGLARNPMIVSIALGLVWSATSLPIPGPADRFLEILGAAATPGALFAIGASLAGKSAERLSVAGWLSFCKLVLHPAAVGTMAFLVFAVDPVAAGVMVAAAALPVAGNVFILAQSYGVAPQRASAAILVSTALSVVTVTVILALLV